MGLEPTIMPPRQGGAIAAMRLLQSFETNLSTVAGPLQTLRQERNTICRHRLEVRRVD